MQKITTILRSGSSIAIGTALLAATAAHAADRLLSGAITAQSGQKLEGVTVSAKLEGSTITTSVYSDSAGNYIFPPLPAGKLVGVAEPLTNKVTVTIGGKPAKVAFAGVSGSGLDQLNVTIPADLADGDAALVATEVASNTQVSLFITVEH